MAIMTQFRFGSANIIFSESNSFAFFFHCAINVGRGIISSRLQLQQALLLGVEIETMSSDRECEINQEEDLQTIRIYKQAPWGKFRTTLCQGSSILIEIIRGQLCVLLLEELPIPSQQGFLDVFLVGSDRATGYFFFISWKSYSFQEVFPSYTFLST